jgi:hypothetical protein
VTYILYGLPDFELCRADVDSGKMMLGGCDISENNPQWHCQTCSHEWGELLERDAMIAARLQRERGEQANREAALARGVMTTRANQGGSAVCPHCKRNFVVKHGLTPEGTHNTCGTFLQILPAAAEAISNTSLERTRDK